MSITEFCKSKVVGTTFYRVPWDKIRVGDQVDLIREPGNQYDAHAIAVLWRGEQVGYIKATAPESYEYRWFTSLSAELCERMKGDEYFFAIVSGITGGTDDRPNKGLNIRIMRQSLEHIEIRRYRCQCSVEHYIPASHDRVPVCFRCTVPMEAIE